MLKSVYDTDNDGVVDNSERLEGSTKAQVQDHNVDAAKITTGDLPDARIIAALLAHAGSIIPDTFDPQRYLGSAQKKWAVWATTIDVVNLNVGLEGIVTSGPITNNSTLQQMLDILPKPGFTPSVGTTTQRMKQGWFTDGVGGGGPTLPTPSAAYRGLVFCHERATGVADDFYVCLRSKTGTYSWKVIVSG